MEQEKQAMVSSPVSLCSALPDTGRGQGSFRLASSRYRGVFDTKKTFRGHTLVMWVKRGSSAGRKAGVVVSKRTFPRAVDRNRAKRLMREAFRLMRGTLAPDVEVILIARFGIARKSRQDVSRDLGILVQRANLEASVQ